MTKREQIRKLLCHLGILLLGLGLCALIGRLLYSWELSQPIVYQSDLNFDFRGLASIVIAVFLGIIFIGIWTIILIISSFRHIKDRAYFWLNNLIAAFPYLVVLAVFGYNRVSFILREKRQNDFIKTPQLITVPFSTPDSIIAAYTHKDTIYFLTGANALINRQQYNEGDTVPSVQIVTSNPVSQKVYPNSGYINGVRYLGFHIDKNSLHIFRLYNRKKISPGLRTELIDSIFYAGFDKEEHYVKTLYYRIKDNYDRQYLLRSEKDKGSGITLFNKRNSTYSFPYLYDFSGCPYSNPLWLPNRLPLFTNEKGEKVVFVTKENLNNELDTGGNHSLLAVFSPEKVIVYKIPRIKKQQPVAVSIVNNRCYLFYQRRILYFLLD